MGYVTRSMFVVMTAAVVIAIAGAVYGSRGFEITNTLIDGVPTTHDPAWASGEMDMDTAIYDHVEVVRGSTGLVAGPGNPSAAINLARKIASSKVLTGDVSFQGGSWTRIVLTSISLRRW